MAYVDGYLAQITARLAQNPTPQTVRPPAPNPKRDLDRAAPTDQLANDVPEPMAPPQAPPAASSSPSITYLTQHVSRLDIRRPPQPVGLPTPPPQSIPLPVFGSILPAENSINVLKKSYLMGNAVSKSSAENRSITTMGPASLPPDHDPLTPASPTTAPMPTALLERALRPASPPVATAASTAVVPELVPAPPTAVGSVAPPQTPIVRIGRISVEVVLPTPPVTAQPQRPAPPRPRPAAPTGDPYKLSFGFGQL